MSEYSLETVFTGSLKVTIEELGSLKVCYYQVNSLLEFARHAYLSLRKSGSTVTACTFELILFDPDGKKLVVKLKEV